MTFEPVWDLYRDGISQSLLSRFIVCPHRFWLATVCGYREDMGFNKSIEYGQMMHSALEVYNFRETTSAHGTAAIKSEAMRLKQDHPHDVWEINHWSEIAQRQFRVYCEHWYEEDSIFEPISSEQTFRVPYRLPSGRSIDLRGKWDALFRKGAKRKSVYLMDHKCRGKIDESGISSTLDQDLQILFYLIPLRESGERPEGVYYNVIQRPLSGGKHTIKKRKGTKNNPGESDSEFYTRLENLMRDNPDDFFKRWTVVVTDDDIDRFKNESLDPLLEQLCDWWESIANKPDDPWNTYSLIPGQQPFWLGRNKLHYRRPFGVYDGLSDGRKGDFHEYLTTGRKHKMVKQDTVFPELEEESCPF